MKKQLIMIATIGVAVCCLGACKKASNGNEYDALNSMLDANYSNIELTVTDTIDENLALTSLYTISYAQSEITVKYSVEKLTEISLDNPTSGIKTTLIGEAVIKDGSVTINGDDAGITADIAEMKLTFKSDYFTNTQLTGNYLKADVKNVSAFLGSQISCTEMKVNATFLEVFYDIQITYTAESGSKVEYKYVFNI